MVKVLDIIRRRQTKYILKRLTLINVKNTHLYVHSITVFLGGEEGGGSF